MRQVVVLWRAERSETAVSRVSWREVRSQIFSVTDSAVLNVIVQYFPVSSRFSARQWPVRARRVGGLRSPVGLVASPGCQGRMVRPCLSIVPVAAQQTQPNRAFIASESH